MTRPILMAACVFLGLAQGIRAQQPSPAKVALVCSQEVESARNVRDLALAQFGADGKIVLLDRVTVERLLGEQKLSLSGLADATTAVRAGKILAVDLFAMVEYSADAKQNTGVVIFDAATGLKLADRGFRDAAVNLQALHVVETVRAAASKWRGGTKSLKTLCFMPVRNADLPRGMDRYCETLSAMLERDVLGFEATALLERKRLNLVNKEKTLAQEAATRELLASLIILEMEVSRGKEGKGIRALVTLRDNAGKELHRIVHEVEDANGTGLLAPLSEKIQHALKTTAGDAAANRDRESQRFLREAKLLWSHKYYALGLQAAEAAYAITPSSDARKLLAEYQMRFATDLIHPGGMRTVGWGKFTFKITPEKLREALDLARRGLQLMEASRPAKRMAEDLVAVHVDLDAFGLGDARRFLFNKMPHIVLAPADPDTQKELEDFRQDCLQRLVEHCVEVTRGPAPNAKMLDRFTFLMQKSASGMQEIALSQTDYTRAMHELATKWLDVAQELKSDAISAKTAATFGGLLSLVYFPNLGNGKLAPDSPLAAMERALKHPHPIVRLYADHGHSRMLFILNELTRAEALARHRALLAEGRRLIDNPTYLPKDQFRIEVYHLLNAAIGQLYMTKNGADIVQEYIDLCDFMLERGDVIEGTFSGALGFPSDSREQNIKTLQIIDKALEVTDSPSRRHFADSPARFKDQMTEARRSILSRMPDINNRLLPWESIKPLIDGSDLNKVNATLLVSVLIHDMHIYYFTGGEDPISKHRQLQLFRMPTEGGPSTLLGKTLVAVDNPPPRGEHYIFWIDPFVASTAIADGKLYAGTVGEGILVFPLAGGAPTRIGEKEGLPSRSVHKVTIVDKTLVSSLEGGYIVTHDLTNGRTETIASSRRAEKLSPFDNGGPFWIGALVADPKRPRVLFRLERDYPGDLKGGLWEYNLATRQFKNLQPVIFGAWGPIMGDRIYLQQIDGLKRHDGGLVAYDLVANEFTRVHGTAANGYGGMKSTAMPPDLSIPFGRHLLHQGYYWAAYPFGRYSLDGKHADLYPSLLGQSWTYNFSARVSLQAVSPSELLVGDYSVLYLMRLKTK